VRLFERSSKVAIPFSIAKENLALCFEGRIAMACLMINRSGEISFGNKRIAISGMQIESAENPPILMNGKDLKLNTERAIPKKNKTIRKSRIRSANIVASNTPEPTPRRALNEKHLIASPARNGSTALMA
jgi:hypothetical protein